MNTRFGRAFRYEVRNYFRAVAILWLVMALIPAAMLAITYFLAGETAMEGSFNGYSIAVGMFGLVLGMVGLRENQRVLNQNGVSRRSAFLADVAAGGVIPVDRILDAAWDLTASDGVNRYGHVTCKVAMLPEALVRKYYDAGLLEIDDWEWTITPYAGYAYSARRVNTDGSLGGYDARLGYDGVRPALYVDSEICLSLEQDEVDLSNQALLGEFTSKELVTEVLRRIAAGEKDPDEDE